MAIELINRTVKRSLASTAIVLFLGASYPSAARSATPLPSPQILMESWQRLHDNVKSSLHSYRLDGHSQLLSEDGQRTPDSKTLASWWAINSEERFVWSFTDGIGPHQIAARQETYDAYSKPSQYDSFLFQNKQADVPIQSYLNYYLAQRVPFRLETFIDSPTAVCTPDALDMKIPFAQSYQKLMPHLKTIGTDKIGSWKCFHVQMPARFQPKGMFLPSDIWFAVVGSQFIPVQFYLYNPDQQSREVITVTKLQVIGTAPVPVTYRTSMDFIETDPSGKKDWGAHSFPRYHEVNLRLSHINAFFPNATFKISAKPGDRVFKDEK